jgi:CheY-like chemotaxis protein
MRSKLDTILLVDDDPISNYVTEELIREKALCQKIITVTDGKQGLRYLKETLQKGASENQELLVLLDLNMPMMDGFEFMEELQALQLEQQILVAVLTSSDNHKDISQAGNYPFVAYLQKPLVMDEISALVAKNFS